MSREIPFLHVKGDNVDHRWVSGNFPWGRYTSASINRSLVKYPSSFQAEVVTLTEGVWKKSVEDRKNYLHIFQQLSVISFCQNFQYQSNTVLAIPLRQYEIGIEASENQYSCGWVPS